MKPEAEKYYKSSEEKFRAGDVEGGFADLDQAIRSDPEDATLYWERGVLRYEGDEFHLAVADFTKVIELSNNPEDVTAAYHRRAQLYKILGEYDKLLDDLDWLKVRDQADENLFAWSADHRRRLGRFEEALADFTKAHQLSPENWEILLRRAQVYYSMKNYKSAIDDLSIIIEAKTARATLLEAVHEWRGKAFFMLGEEAKALDDFNQVQLMKKSFTFSRAEEYIRMFSPGDLET